MYTIDEMNSWPYKKAWLFFNQNAYKKDIPETREYLRALPFCLTQDLREDEHAREKILATLQVKSLVLIDGATLNGKSTLSTHLAKITNASVVDIDLLCASWIENQMSNCSDALCRITFMMNIDHLTDEYIYNNLERIIKVKSEQGTVILVGSYMEIIYRGIISQTLGRYFEQVVSIYCCAKTFADVKRMKQRRDKEMKNVAITLEQVEKEYNYSKRLLVDSGILLGIGMNYSFISDNSVIDKFI